jgi:hypothetical protein
VTESQAIEQGQASELEESREAAVESRHVGTDPLEVSSEEIAVGPYSDDADDEDDVVTLQMDAPLDEGEWMVQTSALERRRLSTEQLSVERRSGALPGATRVWRNGMHAWTPLSEVDLNAPPTVSALPAAVREESVPGSVRPIVPPLAAPPLKRPVPPIAVAPVGVSLVAVSPVAVSPVGVSPVGVSPVGVSPVGVPPVAVPPVGVSSVGVSPVGVPPVAVPPVGASPALGRPVPLRPLASAVLPSPPPPRIAPPASRPASTVVTLSTGVRAPGSSPGAAFGPAALGAGGGRAQTLSPPPPRVEARRSEPGKAVLPAFEAPASARRVDTATSIALDVGPAVKRSSAWGAWLAQGAAALVALLGTSYALTRAGVFEPGTGHARAGNVVAPATSTLALQTAPVVAAAPAAALETVAQPSPAPEAAVPPAAVAPAAVPPAAVSPVPATAESARAEPGAAAAPSAGPDPVPASSPSAGETPAATSEHSAALAPATGKPAPGAGSDAESGEPSARRAKRGARRPAALEARRAPRAVAESPRAVPERAEAASPALEPGSTFDRAAAQAALTAAAEQAKNCRPIGGPSGSGMVQVQYEPSGKVSAVTIVTPGFENSEAAGCIQMLFRRARVPAFNGTKGAVVRQRFEIP